MDVAEHEQRKVFFHRSFPFFKCAFSSHIYLSLNKTQDDITADDLKTAIKISGVHLHSQRAEAESVLAELQRVVNAQSVLQEADKDAVLSPYPRSHYDSLSQRCFTYVPGSTAYPPQSQRSHQQQVGFYFSVFVSIFLLIHLTYCPMYRRKLLICWARLWVPRSRNRSVCRSSRPVSLRDPLSSNLSMKSPSCICQCFNLYDFISYSMLPLITIHNKLFSIYITLLYISKAVIAESVLNLVCRLIYESIF